MMEKLDERLQDPWQMCRRISGGLENETQNLKINAGSQQAAGGQQ